MASPGLKALILWIWLNLALSVSAVVLHTSSRWILDSSNQRVKLRCANWAGHMETNIPEGLQSQSVDYIASWIASAGFNCVRLTYSIDMALNPNVRVQDSFNNAASAAGAPLADLQGVYRAAVQRNPFLATATVQETFSAVVAALAARNVLVILDNHVSRASWCCGMTDGNGWWDAAAGYNANNSRFFNTQNWLEGLRRMARWAASRPNIVAMSLRNELRAASGQDGNNHADWYRYTAEGCNAIHSSNANLLIVVGGVGYATTLDFLGGRPLDRSPYPDKIVWEFHSYAWSQSVTDCNNYRSEMGRKAGYLLSQNREYTGPLWLSEFGWNQNSQSAEEQSYLTCLVGYLESNDAEWAYWALQGSYYVRNGQVNFDESFGLLNRDWSGWRNQNFVQQMGRTWQITQRP